MLALAAVAASASVACELPGATSVVTTTADGIDAAPGDGVCETATGNGVCTLRAAVMEANAFVGPDNITIGSGPYELALPGPGEDGGLTGDLDVTESVSITGPGTVDANGLDRVFDVRAGALILDGPTVTGGHLPSTVVQAVGGGIRVAAGAWVVGLGITVRDNWAFLGGGGIAGDGNASVTLIASTVRENSASGDVGGPSLPSTNAFGGAISMVSGPLRIIDSTIESNAVTELGFGGAIATTSVDATVDVNGSTIAGNSAPAAGAVLGGGAVTIRRSTVVDNPSGSTPMLFGGFVAIRWSTLTTTGPAVVGSQSVTIWGSVLAAAGTDCWPPGVQSFGSNVMSDASCTPAGSDVIAANPMLDPLADNGGPTWTRRPQAGGPAADVIPIGTPVVCDAAAQPDQRGVARPVGPGCDAGSVER